MKIALAQLNPTVGDLPGNEAKLLAAYRRGVDGGVDVVVGSELCVTGYPPRDLLLKKRFVAENLAVLNRLAAATGKTALLTGFVGERGPELREKGSPAYEVKYALRQPSGKLPAAAVRALIADAGAGARAE